MSLPTCCRPTYAAHDVLGQGLRAYLYVTHTGDPLLINSTPA
jgi:hypothetical protein